MQLHTLRNPPQELSYSICWCVIAAPLCSGVTFETTALVLFQRPSMAAVDHSWPPVVDPSTRSGRLSWSLEQPDMQSWSKQTTWIDDTLYNISVLRLPSAVSEDELDNQVSLEAQNLGIIPLQVRQSVDGMSSSMSTMTIASDSINQSSVRSQSTASTSCASSEHRPATQSSRMSDRLPSGTDFFSHVSEDDPKKNSSIRRGLRKMAGFRKKRSGGLTTSSTLTSISSDAESNGSEEVSIDFRSPASGKSSRDSWARPAFAATTERIPPALVDMDALKRSMECKELLDLRLRQVEEKARFLEFQTSQFSHLRSQRDTLKEQKKSEHERILTEQTTKVSCWFVAFINS